MKDMSIQTNQYIMWGALIPYNSYMEIAYKDDKFKSKFEEYENDSPYQKEVGGKDGILILTDGYRGKYAYIGKVLVKTIDGEFLPNTELTPLSKLEEVEIVRKIQDLTGLQIPPSFHVITHYS